MAKASPASLKSHCRRLSAKAVPPSMWFRRPMSAFHPFLPPVSARELIRRNSKSALSVYSMRETAPSRLASAAAGRSSRLPLRRAVGSVTGACRRRRKICVLCTTKADKSQSDLRHCHRRADPCLARVRDHLGPGLHDEPKSAGRPEDVQRRGGAAASARAAPSTEEAAGKPAARCSAPATCSDERGGATDRHYSGADFTVARRASDCARFACSRASGTGSPGPASGCDSTTAQCYR